MMYYNMWGTPVVKSEKKTKVEFEYDTLKDMVDYLKKEADKRNDQINHCLQAIQRNRKDCEQMY